MIAFECQKHGFHFHSISELVKHLETTEGCVTFTTECNHQE